jgi:hypothetical protein
MHILHLINPYSSGNGSFDSRMQSLTMESMVEAKRFAKKDVHISLCYTCLEGDIVEVPSEFIQLSSLSRSIVDVHVDLNGKKLPLIQDILNKTEELGPVDYVIYTNMDIIVLPHFYSFIFGKLNQHDAIVVNRRRITQKHIESGLSEIYADIGLSHPGFDCFVLEQSLLKSFDMGKICIGIPFLESAFTHHIAALAKSPLYVLDQHLTTHIGMEVMPKINQSYYWCNRNEFFKTIQPRLKKEYQLAKFPYAELPRWKRFLKWGLNPSLYTMNYLTLERKSTLDYWRKVVQEMRWRFLQR